MGGDAVLVRLALNVADHFDQGGRDLMVELANYLAGKLARLCPPEASADHVLRQLIRGRTM